MKNLNFSIGILSWKGYASLYNSLKSYEENGLNSLTQSKFICLPEYNNEGLKICQNFGYNDKEEILENNNKQRLLFCNPCAHLPSPAQGFGVDLYVRLPSLALDAV